MLSALLSSRTPNFAQARYAEKYTFRDVEVSKVKFVLGVDRAQVCAQIHCMSTDADDDEEEEEEEEEDCIIEWNNLSLHSFEVIHGFSRVCKLLPDKLATALAVNKENLKATNDSGAVLIEIVQDLLAFYQNARFQVHSAPVTRTIGGVNLTLNYLKDHLNAWDSERAKVTIDSILKNIESYYKACMLYIDFLHPELLAIQRDSNSCDGQRLFQSAVDKLVQKSATHLRDEFYSLFDASH